ncbi:Nitrite-nitrate reduction protein [Halorhabdus tiamatea SARL4B]|uniref:ABC-2-type transporter, permease protein (Probable substrate copper) n=1 Tax=Halorhabdus tiamatea SARL4B TaxID=1033806 RepID=F7PMC4_9EURY|nr:ABC transporter permease subunit [Halorhabdus tiamatea]ERJ05522.1 Nitrite-nitrate reduction protein [Halorhabdus tiamatea SARL4B]CCQ32890.1 ABC-2-type transporter, permease protein (probable substrate copper) [Halorhabdus tiamatea SARL4B]
MSQTLTVARNDFRDVRRSKLLWGVMGIYVAFTALILYAEGTAAEPDLATAVFNQFFLTTLLLPLIAIAGSYLAIAGERESNTVAFLLSQPTSRAAVVAGKFLSRTLLIVGSLLVAFVVGGAIAVVMYPSLEPGVSGAFVVLSIVFVGAYVGPSIAISAATDTRSRAIAGAAGFYVLTDVLIVFGDFSLVGALRFLFAETLGLELGEHFYSFVFNLTPAGSHLNTMYFIFDPSKYPQLPPQDAGQPVYLDPWFSVVILLAWAVVPLAVGYWRFRGAQLG